MTSPSNKCWTRTEHIPGTPWNSSELSAVSHCPPTAFLSRSPSSSVPRHPMVLQEKDTFPCVVASMVSDKPDSEDQKPPGNFWAPQSHHSHSKQPSLQFISVNFDIFELFPGKHCQPWEDIAGVSLHVNWVIPEREFLFPARRTENESRKKKTHNMPHSLSSVDIYVPVREGEALRWKTTHEVRLSRNFIPSIWQIFVTASAQRCTRDQQEPPWSWTSRLHLTLFNRNYLQKGSVSKYCHTEVRASIAGG